MSGGLAPASIRLPLPVLTPERVHPQPVQSVSLGYTKVSKCTRGGFTRASSHRYGHREGSPSMFVTRHNGAVERGLLERLWDLYELAYRRTAEESASREMVFR